MNLSHRSAQRTTLQTTALSTSAVDKPIEAHLALYVPAACDETPGNASMIDTNAQTTNNDDTDVFT